MTASTAAPAPVPAPVSRAAARDGEGAPARRHAAGADPAKRAQILQGAAQVFLDKGFEAASMEDVRRAAGVSKGTIYVYFSDKAELFEALIADKRDRIFAGLSAVLEQDLPLDEKLTRFGEGLCRILCSDEVVAAQRIVIGAVARLPEMGERFYKLGPSHMKARLAEALAREVGAGRLALPDPMMAATQFIELATAGLWRRRLFCGQHGPVDEAEVARTVAAAVDMLLRAYGRGEAARG